MRKIITFVISVAISLGVLTACGMDNENNMNEDPNNMNYEPNRSDQNNNSDN
ncbi:hypothetical protein [Gracilibacillus kekensis]|uniref:Lipoprotein n=1 Tax=Gracilibacillus kekensis TaxID=1027249 RepID=A0A1M7PJE0_9BACI|nr:hypothetical protein [Gracilibacillus kekensis]SHN17305.1 hypothetical protein SAMN05216179_2265 [Gracilibacillus kekensis]